MKPQDLRKYARDTNFRLVVGLFSIISIVGTVLIYLFWGPGAAVLAFLCLAGAILILLLIALVLWLLDKLFTKI